MITVEAINCPQCGAPLEVEKSDRITVCIYCGTRVCVRMVDDHTTATVDTGALTSDSREDVLHSLRRGLQRLRDEQGQIETEIRKLRADNQKRLQQALEAVPEPSYTLSIVGGLLTVGGFISLCLISRIGNSEMASTFMCNFSPVVMVGIVLIPCGLLVASNQKRNETARVKRDIAAELEQALDPLLEKSDTIMYKIDLTNQQIERIEQREGILPRRDGVTTYSLILESAGSQGATVGIVVKILREAKGLGPYVLI